MTADPLPDEAVEAAARALYIAEHAQHPGAAQTWDDGCKAQEDWMLVWFARALVVLTAAAPLIAAQAVIPHKLRAIGAENALTDLRDAIEALHRPIRTVFSWQGGFRMDPICETCHGKAGVHECGCWADEDLVPECAECTGKTGGGQIVTYPCPTIRALDTLLGGAANV